MILVNESAHQRDIYGVVNPARMSAIADDWFDDSRNYDGRVALFQDRLTNVQPRILDMAAGCGTFVLHGLRNGLDVWGVEPEPWKADYFRRKVEVAGYDPGYLERFVPGVGENLPFPDSSFDLVTSWFTIDFVQDVAVCLREMRRVLRPGGTIHMATADHDSWYDGMYRIPMVPRLPKSLGRLYLRAIGRNPKGLDYLQWLTKARLLDHVRKEFACDSQVHDLEVEHQESVRRRLSAKLPFLKPDGKIVQVLARLSRIRSALRCISRRQLDSKNINLWITGVNSRESSRGH